MRVSVNYVNSSEFHFMQKNPEFRKSLKQLDFNDQITKIIADNVGNFSDELIQFIASNIDIYINTTASDDELDSMMEFCQDLFRLANRAFIKANVLQNTILSVIRDDFVYIDKGVRKIRCPYQVSVLNTFEESNMSYCLTDYRNSLLRGHYYVMLYVFDLTLRMQKVKSELFKYELARNGIPSGTALDILVHQKFFLFRELNGEFRKYNKLLSSFNIYGSIVGDCFDIGNILYPTNDHLLYLYYGISNSFLPR